MTEADKKVQKDDEIFDDEDFGQLLEAFDKSNKETITEGIIVGIKDNEVFIDIGEKSEGILDLSEIQDE
ncbi:S1 RNA-binding domain-containing protein, partial [Campylobacter novaezeelandiae]